MYSAELVSKLAEKASYFFGEAREASLCSNFGAASMFQAEGDKAWDELVNIVGESTAREIVY